VGVTRRIVFPTIRLILLAVIAVALVKLAFGGDEAGQPAGPPLTPSAEMTEPQIQVARGSVSNTITLDATITADPAIGVKATAEGKVSVFLAEPGERVVAGDALFEVVFEEPAEASTTTDAEGNVTETQGEPVRRYRMIEAPADGRVSEYTVLVGQTVHRHGDRDGGAAVPVGCRSHVGSRHRSGRTGTVRVHEPDGRANTT
jgi:membrane fusion protein, multidrug efflux system